MSLPAKGHSLGTPPGTLAKTADVKARLAVVAYSPDDYEEVKAESVEECHQQIGKRDVTWIRVEGTKDAETLEKMGECFGFHPLTLEDVMDAGQRPKVEDFGDYLFITFRRPCRPEMDSEIVMEQVNIFLGPGYVLTVTDASDAFAPVLRRVKENRGRIRGMKAGYLAYALIDISLDSFFPTMEAIGGQIELLEDEVQVNPSPDIVRQIRNMKRDLLIIRASIWPMREVINTLRREEPELIADATKLYLRDAYDHTIQIADIAESYREILSETFNVYLSVKADNANEVMRILTIFAAIFIPLTFMAGVYGMNFEFMPELRWRPAYFILLGMMAAVAIAMLRFFRKRGWL